MIIRYDAYGNRDYGWEARDRIEEEYNEQRRSKPSHIDLPPEVTRWLFMIIAAPALILTLPTFLPVYFFWNRIGGMGKAGLVLAGFVLWYPWIFAVMWVLTHWAGH